MTPNPDGITVTGRGEVLTVPDMASVDLGVSVLGATVSDATAEAAVSTTVVVASLVDAGVERVDIATTNYSVSPEYDWQDNQRRLLGYRANNTVRATIRDMARIGDILDGAVSAGGDNTQVSGLTFTIDDDSRLLVAARDAAWADARAKAEQLARLSGRALGRAVAIAELGSGPPTPFPMPRFTAAAAAEMATPIEGGSTSVMVSLHVRYEFA